jgi:hypothetical protein
MKYYTKRDVVTMAAKVYNAAITFIADETGVTPIRLRWDPKLAFQQTVKRALGGRRQPPRNASATPTSGRSSRLTEAQRKQIRNRLRRGESASAIAREFGVSVPAICYYRNH